MGDVSIIARRLEGGTRVQYGLSGNGGYFSSVGMKLLCWYQEPEKVEYLFGLGQMRRIGKPGSEDGGVPRYLTHELDGIPHWLGKSEREIFRKIAFIDYGYFYDLDGTWYYVIPGPFRIKVPLEYIAQHLDENGYEFDERDRLSGMVAAHILVDCYASDPNLQDIVRDLYPEGIEAIRAVVFNENAQNTPCYRLWDRYRAIFNYFDDWVVLKPNEDMSEIKEILVRKKQTDQSKERIETIDW